MGFLSSIFTWWNGATLGTRLFSRRHGRHAGLADAYALLPIYADLDYNAAYERAAAEAGRALALDSTLAEPHATLGYVALRRYAWAEAEAELRRAAELNPNYATAHQYRGKALAAQGRFDEAAAEFARAVPEEEIGEVPADAAFLPIPLAGTKGSDAPLSIAGSGEHLSGRSIDGTIQAIKPPTLYGRNDILATLSASAASLRA